MKPVIKQIDEFAKEVLPEKSDFTNPNEEEEKKIFSEVSEQCTAGLSEASLRPAVHCSLTSLKIFFSSSSFGFVKSDFSGRTSFANSSICLITGFIS